MYIQCKVYLQICRKWRAYNRTIVVQVNLENLKKYSSVLLINTSVFICFQDLPLDVIKKERKKILNARKPDKELQAYFSDPELGLIEVKVCKYLNRPLKSKHKLLSIIIQNNNVCKVISNVLGHGLMVLTILILIYLSS